MARRVSFGDKDGRQVRGTVDQHFHSEHDDLRPFTVAVIVIILVDRDGQEMVRAESGFWFFAGGCCKERGAWGRGGRDMSDSDFDSGGEHLSQELPQISIGCGH